MIYKNKVKPLWTFILLCLFYTYAFASNKESYNKELVYKIPVLDHFGIVGELSLYKISDQRASHSYEIIIKTPSWTKETRYSTYSEFPIFDHIKKAQSSVRTKITGSNASEAENTGETTLQLDVKTSYSDKTFITSQNTQPKLPEQLAPIKEELDAIILGANPLMLKEFDTESYSRWSWVDNVFSSEFEQHSIEIVPSPNEKTLKLSLGQHFFMVIIFDENSNPEAVVIDDAQGRFLRDTYFVMVPLFYLQNGHEIPHHILKIGKYLTALSAYKTLSTFTGQSAALIHNVVELSGHIGHIAKGAIPYLSTEAHQTKLEDKDEDEYQPNYMLGTVDAWCLLATTAEFLAELNCNPVVVLSNGFSLGAGLANLMVSANQKRYIEPHDQRIDDIVKSYYRIYKSLYLKYKR